MSDQPDELDVEEAAIRAALRRRITELKESAGRMADPRPWIEERPWSSCAGAAGLGFAVGWMMAAPKAPRAPVAPEAKTDHEAQHRGLGAVVAASVLPALQPMLKELVDTTLGTLGLHGHKSGPDLRQAADVPSPESMTPGMSGDNQVV